MKTKWKTWFTIALSLATILISIFAPAQTKSILYVVLEVLRLLAGN